MKRSFKTAAFAATLLLTGVSADALLAPVAAQGYGSVDFDTFHDQLAPYGDWVYSDRWGEVWMPTDVPDNFRPYDTDGYWAYTDEYGWYWASNYEWGDIPFHYGRWVNDPDDGWLWIPGYVWSPAWVAWRSNGQYIGWMPMPPDRQFLGYGGRPSLGLSFGRGGFGLSFGFGNASDYYGYSQWYGPGYGADSFAANWVFIQPGHMADRDFHRYQAPRGSYASLIRNTRNITNYTVVNNYVVNRSVDVNVVSRAAGHQIQPIRAAQVIKRPQFVMQARQGDQIQTRMRTQMPRGTGLANSAPKPSSQVIQSLSTKATPRGGHAGAHLYTRDTVTSAPLPTKPGGAPNNMPDDTNNKNPMQHGPSNGTSPIPGANPPGGNPGMNGETKRRGGENGTPPNGAMTPNNGATPNGTGSPNGMNGPGGERRHGNDNGAPPNGAMTPNNGGAPQNGMNGPNGSSAPTGSGMPDDGTRHRDNGMPGGTTPDQSGGSMTGPSHENETPRRQPSEQTAPPATGPAGGSPSNHSQDRNSGRPGGMPSAGPNKPVDNAQPSTPPGPQGGTDDKRKKPDDATPH